jgi:hypothetical protein
MLNMTLAPETLCPALAAVGIGISRGVPNGENGGKAPKTALNGL